MAEEYLFSIFVATTLNMVGIGGVWFRIGELGKGQREVEKRVEKLERKTGNELVF